MNSLANVENPVWYPYYGSWMIAFVAEALLLAFGLAHGFTATPFAYVRMTVQIVRSIILVILPVLLFSKSSKGTPSKDEESAALLGQSTETQLSNGVAHYGSIAANPSEVNLEYEAKKRKKDQEEQRKLAEKLQESGNWFKYGHCIYLGPRLCHERSWTWIIENEGLLFSSYISKFSILLPLMWPSQNRLLQLNMVGVGICLICARVLKVLEPRQLGIVLDRLDLSQGHVPVSEVLLYMLYGFLSTSVVSPVRRLLWMPVEL